MLPLVLGGIALAAVGYGVKEYCEEDGCPWDDTSHATNRSKSIEELLTVQRNKIFKEKVPELEALLLKVNAKFVHLQKSDSIKGVLDEVRLSEDVKRYMQIQKSLLDDAEDILQTYVSDISTLVATERPYAEYSKEEKDLVKKAYKITKQLPKYLDVALHDAQGKALSKGVVSMLKCRELFTKHETFLAKASSFDVTSVGLGSVFAHIRH